MKEILQVKELQQQDLGPYQISERLQIDSKTARKYMTQEDFSPSSVTPAKKPRKIDPYREKIDAWLEDDLKNRRKQRHTAKRVFDRLKSEFGDALIGISKMTFYKYKVELFAENIIIIQNNS